MEVRQSSQPPELRKLPVLLRLRDLTPAPVPEPPNSENDTGSESPAQVGELRRERRRRQAVVGASAFRHTRAIVATAAVLVLGLGYFALRSGGSSDAPVAEQAWETDSEAAELSPPTVTLDAGFWEEGEASSEPALAKEPNNAPPSSSAPQSRTPYQAVESPPDSQTPSPVAASPQPPLTPPIPTAAVVELPPENEAFAIAPPQAEVAQPNTPPAYPTTGVQYSVRPTLQLPTAGAPRYRAPRRQTNLPPATNPYGSQNPSARTTPGSYQR